MPIDIDLKYALNIFFDIFGVVYKCPFSQSPIYILEI